MRKWCYSTAILLALCGSAQAAPPEVASVIHAGKPYGEGAYTWMLIKAYDASLWTDAPKWSWDATFALTLRYNMRFKSEDLAQRSITEMDHITPLSAAQRDDYARQLAVLFPSVKSGDTITALYVPGKEARFYHDGKATGTVNDADFAKRFFSIWLSEKTSAPSLRSSLLGTKN